MKKTIHFFCAIITGVLLSNICVAAPHNLYGYQINKDGETKIDYKEKFHSVSSPEKKGWRDYIVNLNIERSYKDDKGATKNWVEQIRVHFTGEKAANAFSRVMSSDKATDLYYDFSENSYNGKASTSACAAAFLGVFCKDFPAVIRNYHDLDADDIFANVEGAHKTVPLYDYLDKAESGKYALMEEVRQEDLAATIETNDSERGISPKHDLNEKGCKCKQKTSGSGVKA